MRSFTTSVSNFGRTDYREKSDNLRGKIPTSEARRLGLVSRQTESVCGPGFDKPHNQGKFLLLRFSVVGVEASHRGGNEQVVKPVGVINKAIEFVSG